MLGSNHQVIMKNNVIPTSLLISLMLTLVQAQVPENTSYVITNNNDTLFGRVSIKHHFTPNTVAILKTTDGKQLEFRPEAVK